jgi:hypothetical protein
LVAGTGLRLVAWQLRFLYGKELRVAPYNFSPKGVDGHHCPLVS